MSDPSDEQLAIRMQRHDGVASTEFYNRHKRDVLQYCCRLLQSKQCAEDALQSSFLKFFTSIGELRAPVTVKSWLYSIVRNEVYSTLRKTRKNGSIEEIEIPSEETPYDAFVREEDAGLVQRLIEELKPEYHEVLYLLEYERMTYAEIAEITGITVSAVETRIFRARKELSKRLIPYMK